MTDSPLDNIRIEAGDEIAGREIELNLLNSLSQTLAQSNNSSFVLTARDSLDLIIAGLTASTSYGWLLVKVLWVNDKYRGHGMGRALMNKAELKARQSGCHGAWLDTSNPDAMLFYQSLGYTSFGQLNNSSSQYPPGHSRWFMKKEFSSDE